MRSGTNRPPARVSNQWVEYEWSQPVITGGIAVFWWNFGNAVRKLEPDYGTTYWFYYHFAELKQPNTD